MSLLQVVLVAALLLPVLLEGAFTHLNRESDPVERNIVRIRVTDEASRQRALKRGQLVEDYGSFVLIKLSEGTDPVLQEGESKLSRKIHIGGFSFNPAIRGELEPFYRISDIKIPEDKRNARSASIVEKNPGKPEYRLIQFIGPVKNEWLGDLKEANLTVIQYVPDNCFIVHGNTAAFNQIENHPKIRWTGAYLSEFKYGYGLEKHLSQDLQQRRTTEAKTVSGLKQNSNDLYHILVFSTEDLKAVSANLIGMDATILGERKFSHAAINVLIVRMPDTSVALVAEEPGVMKVARIWPKKKHDECASLIVTGNYSGPLTLSGPGYDPLGQFGVDGSGATIAICDDGIDIPGAGGFYITSGNTVSGPRHEAPLGCQDGHGQMVASVAAGSMPYGSYNADGYNYGMGVAPGASLVDIPLLYTFEYEDYSIPYFDDYDGILGLNETLGTNGIRASISNNSWGESDEFNVYSASCFLYDLWTQDASDEATVDPLLFVFSAGNSGDLGITSPATAKNVITAGGSVNLRPKENSGAYNLDRMYPSSSRGLTADGRIKPDILAPGQVVTGGRPTTQVGTGFSIIDPYHIYASGTSFAAPAVSGAAALLTDYWRNMRGHEPSPAFLKALLINGAVDMSAIGDDSEESIPNGIEGWGRINLNNSIPVGPGSIPVFYRDQNRIFENAGEVHSFEGHIAKIGNYASGMLKVSLVWTDPPGIGDPALVNNLDLEVVVNGATYLGNVFNLGVSGTGGQPDSLNNVENVYIRTNNLPENSHVEIRVIASSLNGNGDLENPQSHDQHYALVAQNFVPDPIVELLSMTILEENFMPPNNRIDPGESVVAELELSNPGDTAINGVTVTLLENEGVTEVGGADVVEAIPAGGTATAQLAFTCDPSFVCGDTVTIECLLENDLLSDYELNHTFELGNPTEGNGIAWSNMNSLTIPIQGAADPYPSTILVSDAEFPVGRVTVEIFGYTHTATTDMNFMVQSPSGQAIILMSAVGENTAVNNIHLTFDDFADKLAPPWKVPLPNQDQSYKPSLYLHRSNPLVFSSPAPEFIYLNQLVVFNEQDPNGLWKLFVYDENDNDQGSISGWRVNIYPREYICSTPPVDTDEDGMPDDYENDHGLNADDPNDATLDLDGDGVSNLREYYAGTDPQNNQDYLRIVHVSGNNGDLELQFPSVSGLLYILEMNTNPLMNTEGWQSIPETGTITGDGNIMTVIHYDAFAGRDFAFYRLRLATH